MSVLPLSLPLRKVLLIVAGGLICCYAVSVLWYVESIPDIGLRCAFTTEVDKVLPQFVYAPEGDDFPPPEMPRQGDVILQVAGKKVRIWPEVLRALQESSRPDHPPKEITTLTKEEERSESYARLGQQTLVRVEFERPNPARTDATRYACWMRLGRLPFDEFVPSVLWFCLKIGLFAVGALVFWNRPSDQAAAQFFLLCIVTVGAYMGGYHWARIATSLPLLMVFIVCGVLLPVVSLHFYLIFPRPKSFVVQHPWKTFLVIYGPPLAFLLVLLAHYLSLRGLVRGGASDLEIDRAWTRLRAEVALYLLIAALWYVLSVVGLVHSFRSAEDVTERNQVKWILFGSVVALVPIGYTLYLIFWERDAFSAGKATWPMFGASVCFTIAFAVSITRYRLLQLDQIVSSGAIYVFISILAAIVYYAVVFAGMLAANMVGSQVIAGTSLAQTLWVSTTALILLLILNLARSRFKKAVDRRFYRQKHQLDRTLKRMGEAIEQLVDPPTLARRLLQTSAELLNVTRGAVYLREGEPALYRVAGCLGSEPPALTELSPGCPLVSALESNKAVAAWPENPADPAQRQLRFLGGELAYALSHESQLLAFLVLGPKDLGFYRSDDLNLLAAFAQFTTLALESAQGHHTIEVLNRDLRGKVEKISEQQRRILALQNQLTKDVAIQNQRPADRDSNSSEKNGAGGPPSGPAADPFQHVIGTSESLRLVIDMGRKVAPTPSAVLIRGESGTGKELLARALHESSHRAGKPYVKVHCAALSPGLLESELFGHVKGAFTGAHRDKVGRFELANGGTIFLDEIGDVSWDVQTKLLRVIQEKTFERVGSSAPVKVDVRVIAATHQDLEAMIKARRFRDDLYYRLNVIDMRMPPLRERVEDIPELTTHFLRIYAERCHKPILQVDDDALAILKSHQWPGNIRELENVVERAVVVAEGNTVSVADLPPDLVAAAESTVPAVTPWKPMASVASELGAGGIRAEREMRARRERDQLVRALAATSGNKAEAARALDLARSTLLSRLKKYGLS